jgi:dihydroorotate dehydrogenase
MPDWFYRTVSRPLLFRLPAATARDLTLGFMGGLARLPLGPSVIDFLGHMRADRRLQRTFMGLAFPSPIGLGAGIDIEAAGFPALARFGVGFIEIGPVTTKPVANPDGLRRDHERACLWLAEPPPNAGLARIAERLARRGKVGVPIGIRLGILANSSPDEAAEQCRLLVESLAPHAQFFTLPCDMGTQGDTGSAKLHLQKVLDTIGSPEGRPLLLCLHADAEPPLADQLLSAFADRVAGVVVDGTIGAQGGRLLGPPAREAALGLVRHLRQRSKDLVVMASGGVHEPADALNLRRAGADLVLIDSGIVFAGPGLPKRTNEAILRAEYAPADAASGRPAEMAWFWSLLMGLGMLVGAVLALAISATRVVLPYDEAFVGMDREQLRTINERLLDFMAHDRVSLAGTMISLGVLYVGLSLGGIRRGMHWARWAVFSSAFVGFGTFFLFLGFGYFDPFHAFVTVVLLQFLLLALHARESAPCESDGPNLREDRAWRLGLWGQLLMVIQGVALLGAGLTISTIGATHVFVPEDLEFMDVAAETLARANPRLIPVVAHDRATMGGMLVSSGVAVLLTALWGFGQGRRWLWWTLLAAGAPAYLAAIGVHLVVGYTNLWHLAPALGGFGLFLASLALAYPYLVAAGDKTSG